eukprot:237332_1
MDCLYSIRSDDLLSFYCGIKFFDGTVYVMHHKYARETAVGRLFTYWSKINKHDFRIITSTPMQFGHIASDFSMHMFENIIPLELICQPCNLADSLLFIAKNSKILWERIITSQDEVSDNFALLELLGKNRLILSKIFEMDQIIWKAFIYALICLLATHNTCFSKKKKIKTAWDTYSHILTKSIRYWKLEHFEFAINNQLIQASYSHRSDFRLIAHNIDMLAVIVFYLRRIDKRNKLNLVKKFLKSMRKDRFVDLHHYKLYKLFKDGKIPWTEKQLLAAVYRCCINVRHSTICSWVLCQNSLRMIGKLSKCKRCKMVEYCCRNHQKKHWKYIHRQQCKKY